jgi:hypothetical protein
MSSACHTEYDNADDSDGACSDSEMITTSRLEDLKRALKGSPIGNGSTENKKQKRWRQADAFVSGKWPKTGDEQCTVIHISQLYNFF